MTRLGAAPRVLVVDDHELFGESLRIALESSHLEAVRAPDLSASELLLLAERFEPHVVLLDLQLEAGASGLDLVAPLRQLHAEVVMVTGVTDPAKLGACFEAGALSVISKSEPLEMLVGAVGRALSGQSVNAPSERAHLLEAVMATRRRHTELDAMLAALTNAEREVFAELVQGRSAETIARARVVSIRTVRSQIEAILSKLHVSSQLAAVALANEAGWFPPEPYVRQPGQDEPRGSGSDQRTRSATGQRPRGLARRRSDSSAA